MADFASSLPIRTENAGDVEIKVVDGTLTTRKLTIDVNGAAQVAATDFDVRDLTFATDKVDVTGSSVTATATDFDIRNLTFATDKVDASGSTVSIVSPGTSVADYNTAAAVAKDATSIHTYTAASNFTFTQFLAAASDKLKIVVKVDTVTKFVMFNSVAEPNLTLKLENPLSITTGQTVTIERINLGSAQDIYSTIMGYTT